MTKAITKAAPIKRERQNIKGNLSMYILLLPSFIVVLVFAYLPMAGIVIAFKDFDALAGIAKSPWVGLNNFKQIITTPNFLHAIKNTLVYSTVTIFGTFPFPIILALLFNEIKNTFFKRTVQTISYFPHFISWISVCGFVYGMFAIDGTVNDILVKFFKDGYERTNILFNSKNFLPIIFISNLWKGVGWSSVIYLAAITGIDGALYEAAEIDGANKLQQAIHITIPSIKVTAILILVMGLGGLVNNNFEQVYGLQNSYIQNETEVIGTLIYRQGIQGGKYSLATAFGIMQGLVSLLLVVSANRLSKKISDVSLW